MQTRGFHLLELLIVISLISILASIALPIYHTHFLKTRRLIAEETLYKLALALETYHLEKNTYEDATLSALNFPESIADNHYRLSINTVTSIYYQIAATPENNQLQDEVCKTLILDSTGKKSITGGGSIKECWE